MVDAPDGGPDLSRRIRQVLAIDPAADALEFERGWSTWGDLATAADAVGAQVAPGERVAVLLRNRPAHVGLVLGLLAAGACVVTTNPERGIDRVQEDLVETGVATIAGERADLEALAPRDRRWLVTDRLGDLAVTGSAPAGDEPRPGVAVEMLTSGTTGPPKRVPLTYETLLRVLVGAKHYERNPDEDVRLRRGVTIANSPLVHLGGLFRILQCVFDGRAMCLLEKFRVPDWAEAVRRHQPRTVSLVPAALRMVLDADLDRADFTSVRSVISGTAPLAPEDADAFLAKYGVPVLVSYAATEFGGGVAGWNLADHEQHWADKKGSVGRAHPGCELRVVDAATGDPVAADVEGLLEVRARQMGDDAGWTRTTDLARIDADGFVWILGRADQAIIRGGFKVRPEDVRVALERDPRVRGAAVVGRLDARLGEVPVAAVELRDVGSASVDELLADAARVLARYELPAEVRIVATLPRTPSGKVDLGAVRDLFAEVSACSTEPPPERWTFGVEPLPQALVAAPLLRRVAGLLLALEHEDPAVDRLVAALREADDALTAVVSEAVEPRLGDAPTDRRPYVDHARNVGAFDPCFPEYSIRVDGNRATGTVTFPLAFEGPPAVVHGGVLATFFDCVIQHHSCDVGAAGKTTSLLVDYRRPTPLGQELQFEIERAVEDRRITSRARLAQGDRTLCTATMEAVAGDRRNLPAVSPRRSTP